MVNYDELAQDYQRHRQVHPEVLKQLIATSEVRRDSTVLEVGCGTGNYIHAFHSATDAKSWGVDASEQMLTQAKHQSPDIVFSQGLASSLQFGEAFFDFVFSVDLVQHLEDIIPYFSEVFRILKPGGRICTVTDSEEIIRTRRPLAFYFPDTITVDIERYPSLLVLRKRMGDAGFQNIKQIQAEFSYELRDIEAYRTKAFSCLHLISPEAFQAGLTRLEGDLAQGPIPANSRYVLLFGHKPTQIVYL
ncbi:methyltransferase domain-containing protein [Candidatus Bathyarchaeota archaeon]|nr:methyltransferase domain-containing protein [Candidatus Bathyarchaeota archaeon]